MPATPRSAFATWAHEQEFDATAVELCLAHRPGVRDVAFNQRAIADSLTMAGHEIVEHDDRVAGALQRLAGVAADVPRSPRHQDRGAISGQWRST